MDLLTIPLKFKDVPIYCWHIQPGIPKGTVVLVHGLGEHSGRYLSEVVPQLLKAKLAVIGYDNIGHGRSGGKRGHCPDYEALMFILHQVILKGTSIYPNLPLFLYGHSMGGNLVLNYALRSKLDLRGVVATSPYLRLAFNPPKWKMVLGKSMLKWFPGITLSSGLDPHEISRIPEEVERYMADPLVHDRVSPMFSFPVMEAGEWAIKHAHLLKTETLLLHGTGDRIIDFKGTENFHDHATATTLKLMDGAYHELHNDICRQEILSYITTWLRARV